MPPFNDKPADMSELPLSATVAYRALDVRGVHAGTPFERQDCVATEVPVAFEFNGISHAVLMATPTDLEDFAYGFSVTEGVVDSPSQIHDCEWLSCEQGTTLKLTIATSCFSRLKERRRTLTGRTGCGLCGTESLAQAVRYPPPLQRHQYFTSSAVTRALTTLREQQALLSVTGSTHAAAWCRADGHVEFLREDVGRHNALDKLIGALARHRRPADEGFVVITSRASYEMVQKTVVAGISLLAAMSGVTEMAVDVARQSGLTLLGFARGNDVSIYSHPQRLTIDTSHA